MSSSFVRGQSAGAGGSWIASAFVRDHAWTLTVWGAMALWVAALFTVAHDRYSAFRYARFDLGNMVQAVWSTSAGRPLEITNAFTGEQMVRLGGHVDPILVALAPLWIAVPSPLVLEAVQIAAVALGALPLYWLGRRHSGSPRAAAVLAAAYLAYPWTAWTAVDSLHPVTLAIPCLLFAIWFLDSDRLLPFAAFAVLAASTGELMGAVVATLGIWYWLARGRRRAGAVIAALGLGWTAIAIYVIVPAFSGGPSVFYGPFAALGGSPQGVLRTAVTDPLAILSALSEGADGLYVALLLAPLAGAVVLAPWMAAVAVPQLLVNLLADDRGTTDPHEHYVAAVVPFLFAAIALGLSRLSRSNRERVPALVLVLSAAASLALGPWPRTLLGASSWGSLPSTPERIRALERALELVPPDARVGATNRIGSHLAARRYFYSVPAVDKATWIVIESDDAWVPGAVSGASRPDLIAALRSRLAASSSWTNVLDEDGVLVFRKVQS